MACDAHITPAAAKARKLDGQYLIVLTNTTQQPILASLKNRDLRARQRLRDKRLGPGYTADPMTVYRDFRSRDPSVKALERERGLD